MGNRYIIRFFETVIGPSIVGIVVLIGQFYIQPRIGAQEYQKKELLRLKEESYIEAITIINEYTYLIRFDKSKNPSEDNQANNVMAKLLLLSDDKQITDKFWAILIYEKKENDNFQELLDNRRALVDLMRTDIGK